MHWSQQIKTAWPKGLSIPEASACTQHVWRIPVCCQAKSWTQDACPKVNTEWQKQEALATRPKPVQDDIDYN